MVIFRTPHSINIFFVYRNSLEIVYHFDGTFIFLWLSIGNVLTQRVTTSLQHVCLCSMWVNNRIIADLLLFRQFVILSHKPLQVRVSIKPVTFQRCVVSEYTGARIDLSTKSKILFMPLDRSLNWPYSLVQNSFRWTGLTLWHSPQKSKPTANKSSDKKVSQSSTCHETNWRKYIKSLNKSIIRFVNY